MQKNVQHLGTENKNRNEQIVHGLHWLQKEKAILSADALKTSISKHELSGEDKRILSEAKQIM